ncbi:MAG TPA: hypothetical protein VFE32_17495 [Puia sp.]|jgi:hypothetical protein|nr:hypothetical protein [Puia sp.]
MTKWIPLICTALIIGAVFYFLRGCYSPPSHAGDNASLDSAIKALQTDSTAKMAHIAQLQQDSADQQNQINWLMAERSTADSAVVVDGKAIGHTIGNLHTAEVQKDTIRIIATCDTLSTEVEAGKVAVSGYRLLTDSLVSAMVQQGMIKDSTAASWRSLYLHADTTVNFQAAKYNALYSDYQKVGGRLKFSQFLNKGLAGAIVVVLLGALLKK